MITLCVKSKSILQRPVLMVDNNSRFLSNLLLKKLQSPCTQSPRPRMIFTLSPFPGFGLSSAFTVLSSTQHVPRIFEDRLTRNPLYCVKCSYLSSKTEHVMNVFDRKAKRIQRNRTANFKDYKKYEYLKEEFGWRMADRISDVKRKFEVAVDVGCGRGYIGRHCYSDMIGTLYQMDIAEKLLDQIEPNSEIKTVNIVGDEEFFPFKENSVDLVISSLNLHWVNDLPGTFLQIFKSLKSDGCFMGAMFGGDTLFELRCSLQLAETEREGGFAPHVSPFTSVQDLGNLLNRAGYVMLTIDIDEIVVNYPSMFELMDDLKGMGENNCQWSRRLLLPKDTQMTAAAIYKEMYGSTEDDSVPATFQVICFIAWKPDSSQPKLAKRGSGQVSIKDVDKLDQLTKQVKDMQKDIQGSAIDKTIDKLNKDLERLKQTVIDDQDKDK